MTGERLSLGYTRAAALVTMAFYTAGHSAIGLPLFLAGATVRAVARRPPLWRQTPCDVPLVAFGAALALSTWTSAYRPIALIATVVTVLSTAVFFGSFAWLVDRDPSARIALLRVWALGAPPAAVVGVITGWVVHDRAFFPRMPLGPNGFGTTLLLGSLAALGLAYSGGRRGRSLWLSCALVALAGLLATESRAALAGWMGGAAYLTWRQFRARPAQLAGVLAAGAAVLVLAAAAVPSAAARVEHFSTDLVRDRLQIWRTAAEIVEAHPLLGTGPGTFQIVFNQRKPAGSEAKWSAHNLWIHYAVETGLLGLASILWIVYAAAGAWIRAGRRLPRGQDPLRPTIAALALGLVINQCGDNTLLSVSTISGALLLLALVTVPLPRPTRPGSQGLEVRDRARRPTMTREEALLAAPGGGGESPP